MNFEEWWNLSGASVTHKVPKDAARDAWQSAYMQACKEMVPKGYVLVPVEPTAKMLEAGEDPYDCLILSEIYQAMIKAAQEEE